MKKRIFAPIFVYNGIIGLFLTKTTLEKFLLETIQKVLMTLRETFGIVVLVVILQLCLGVLVYGPLKPAPGLELHSIAIAIAVMAAVAGSIAAVLAFLFKRYADERTTRVAMMTLSDDERQVLQEIMRLREVRQDELRRKVDMSKSKLSALVNNLEQKGAIVKLRYHKTNILRPTKEFGG